MGCIADKPLHDKNEIPPPKPRPNLPAKIITKPFLEKDPIAKSRLLEAIKKRDIILFQKTVELYNFKPNDVLGPSDQNKTILHKLVEYNFSEGMSLMLQDLSSGPKKENISPMVNAKDCDGNTPLLLCCLLNSMDTLKVLVKDEHTDTEAKNNANKTALEIAMEMESPCVNILTSLSHGSGISTKHTLKTAGTDSLGYVQSLDEVPMMNGADSRTSLCEMKPSFINLNNNNGEYKDLKGSFRYPQVIGFLEVQGANFKDTEFPHEACYVEHGIEDTELKRKYPDLAWKRPVEFMGAAYEYAVLFDTFTLGDVKNSPLVGSEFYSALAVMTEFPQRLSKVFNTKRINQQGVYSLSFFVSGASIEILVDDYFPCKGANGPLYARPGENEMWFMLIEKAFAKLYGSYKELERLSIMECLEILTGMPLSKSKLVNAEEDKLWRKLMDYDKKNYMICGKEVEKANRRRNRVFSVVHLYEVDGCRLLKLRNHYGDYDWKGDFSVNSPVWSRGLREQVGYNFQDKTCFFMTVKDFMKVFEVLHVCHYHDNWVKKQMNSSCAATHAVYFEVNVEKEMEAYISIHQKLPEFCHEGLDYDISPVEVVMARDLDGQNLDNIGK